MHCISHRLYAYRSLHIYAHSVVFELIHPRPTLGVQAPSMCSIFRIACLNPHPVCIEAYITGLSCNIRIQEVAARLIGRGADETDRRACARESQCHLRGKGAVCLPAQAESPREDPLVSVCVSSVHIPINLTRVDIDYSTLVRVCCEV